MPIVAMTHVKSYLNLLDDWSNIGCMTRIQTRYELIRVGGEMIARKGFNSTGLNAVLCEAGVPKGSFYYYFASKDEFGLAVIDEFEAEQSARMDTMLTDQSLSPLQRIRKFFDAGLRDMEIYDYGRGCPIGNLSQELASQNELFRKRLDNVFNGWRDRFARCLAQACEAGELADDADVTRLAEFLLAGWQGASLRAKVTRSLVPMTAFVGLFFERVLPAPS